MITEQFPDLLQESRLQCAEIRGAVIATNEGFILAANGQFDDESFAASSVYVMNVVERHLSSLNATHCHDLLIWSDTALWHLVRIGNHVLMTTATPDCNAGILRLITRGFSDKIATVLAQNTSAFSTT